VAEDAAQEPVRSPAQEGWIGGRVLGCDGFALPGVRVLLEQRVAVTDADGAFTFEQLRPGRWHEVKLDVKTLPPGYLPPWWQRDDEHRGRWGRFTFASGAPGARASPEGEQLDIALSQGTVLRGRVLDRGGSALGAATVSIRRGAHTSKTQLSLALRTDELGAYETPPLPEGDWHAQLNVRTAPGEAWPDPIPFSLDCAGGRRELDLEFDDGFGEGRVLGQVADVEGRPREGVMFVLQRTADDLSFSSGGLFYRKARTYSNANGRFELRGLPAGDYALSQVGVPDDNNELELLVGSHDLLPVRLESGASIARVEWVVETVRYGGLRLLVGADVDREPGRRVVAVRRFAHRAQPVERSVPLADLGAEGFLWEVPAGPALVEVRRALGNGRELVEARLAVTVIADEWLDVQYDGALRQP
jgi:hypothetical protein